MFTLRRLLQTSSGLHLKQILRNCRNAAASSTEPTKVSSRTRDWIQSQEKYAQHSLIVYSSHLENQEEFMNFRRLRTQKRKRAWEEQRKLREKETRPLLWPQEADLEQLRNTFSAKDDDFPYNWMGDYEFYDGEEEMALGEKKFGTAIPEEPPSKVPCSGCGAHLHCQRPTLPGYLPSEIFKGRTNRELKTLICQRCHFLKHYNIALDLEVTADSYVETISRIKDQFALAVLIVDLTDFPCSIWPGMQKVLGSKRPIFVVGNKVDLLPRDHNNYLEHIKQSLKQQLLECGFDALNIKHIGLVSAKTGYGVEELITQLHKIWRYNGDVYLLGCTNVGKSTLFNILLQSDYCRPEASELVRRATTCPWPGTTLQMLKFPIYRPSEIRVYQRFRRLFSERAQKAAVEKLRHDQARLKGNDSPMVLLEGSVGRTFVKPYEDVSDAFSMSPGTQPMTSLNERSASYREAKWCYDTPGVMHPAQITNLLTPAELQQLQPRDMIAPRAVRLKQGMSVFMGGLARLDFIECRQGQMEWVKALLFCSLQLPVVITETVNAEAMYEQYVGSEVLGLPFGDGQRMQRWPGLDCRDEVLQLAGNNEEGLSCDVLLSSAGWIGLKLPYGSECTFKAWTPHAKGIYVRLPALVPYGERLVGKRIPNTLAYNLRKPFVFKK